MKTTSKSPIDQYPGIPIFDSMGGEICQGVRRLKARTAKTEGQRTDAWKAAREELLTASSVSSTLKLTQLEIDLRDNGIIDLEPEKKVGQVMPSFNSYAKELRSKCGLEKSDGGGSVFTEWGVTYEPVVKELYERFFNVVVHDFGLVKHETLDWLGASPDGVTSQGRMIEIKCPYSRQPKGMPKSQYYVQMQIQMECCGFDECDFLDIVLREYGSKEEYLNDHYGTPGTPEFVHQRNSKGMPKGLVVEWERTNPNGKVQREYFYPPVLTFQNQAEEEAWIEQWSEKHFREYPLNSQRTLDIIYRNTDVYRFRYWWIDEWHATLITKNIEWLKQRLPDMHDFWKLVLKCRKEGIPDKYKPRNSNNNDQLFVTQSGKLTKEPTDTECLFWDNGEDMDQPIITNIKDVRQEHVPLNNKKRQLDVAPLIVATKKKAYDPKSSRVTRVAQSSDCLFDDDDENYGDD